MRFAPGLAPLRHRDFALYFTGLTVSQCGSWMEQTLTTWLLYDITGSPVLLGIGGALCVIGCQPAVDRVRGSLWAETIDGVRYTLGKRILANLLFLESIHSLFGANTALVTIVAKDVLHVGPEGLGFLLSALGAGALVGTGALVMSGDVEQKGRSMMLSAYAYVASFAVFAWSRSYELSAVTLAAVGFADTWWATMRNSIFQLQADEAYRGRTLSAFLLVGRGMAQTSQLQTGLAVEAFGPAVAATAGAALIAVAIVGVNARDDEVRRFRDPRPAIGGPPTDAAAS